MDKPFKLDDIDSLPAASLRELLERTGAVALYRCTACGISMAPFIRDGDVITLRPSRGTAPSLGSVVAFIHPASGQLLVHRVVARRRGFCVTRGDNSLGSDGLISEKLILATVVTVERNGVSVRFGGGGERLLIVLLIRSKLLHPLLSFIRAIA